MKIIITGTAGFIGFHLAMRLLQEGHEILGIDCVNNYYDVDLKLARLKETGITIDHLNPSTSFTKSDKYSNYLFAQLSLEDKDALHKCFVEFTPEIVINLAAQAGVRYSLINPDIYASSNVVGFLNVLEECRHFNIKHLVYASSSSVYGLSKNNILSTAQSVDHPISLYAATKKSNELMAHAYSHLFGIKTTGLRFFTVYGPWGRPDMALFIFTKSIIEGASIEVYNNGDMFRDFTYIDDIVDGICRVSVGSGLVDKNLSEGDSEKSPLYDIFNIGNGRPVKLTAFVDEIEMAIGKKANRIMKSLQPGDVVSTYADIENLRTVYGYSPSVDIKEGVSKFVEWYRTFYGV